MESLDKLEQNLHLLLEQHRSLKATSERLDADNKRLNNELREAHAEIVTLQRRQRQLQTVISMLGNEGQKTYAYREITYLIQLVDKALTVLNDR